MAGIVALVVTYNRKTLLEQCLQCLGAQTVPCDILVVDNASTDGTADFLKEQTAQNPKLGFHKMDQNMGGAGGFHFGMKLALEKGYEFVWLMDDDTLPRPDALEKLLLAHEALEGNCGWLSSVAVWHDDSLCVMNLQRETPFKKLTDFSAPLIKAQMASFVSLLVHYDTARQVGMPIKEFFIWTDDWEYTRRISKTKPCFVVSDSKVLHAMSANVGSSIAVDTIERMDRYRLAFRNEYCVYRREGLKGILYYFSKCVLNFVRILLKAPDNRILRLRTLRCGVHEGRPFYQEIKHSMEARYFASDKNE